MNIKEKLIEQITALGKAQKMAFNSGDPSTVTSVSMVMLDYIKQLEDYEDDEDYICPECEEAIMKAELHREIANRCDLPVELVDRVLSGQDEVFKDLD